MSLMLSISVLTTSLSLVISIIFKWSALSGVLLWLLLLLTIVGLLDILGDRERTK
jgi:hypothetical protein